MHAHQCVGADALLLLGRVVARSLECRQVVCVDVSGDVQAIEDGAVELVEIGIDLTAGGLEVVEILIEDAVGTDQLPTSVSLRPWAISSEAAGMSMPYTLG